MSKTAKVLAHLEEYGSITSMQAIERYKATRLSSIIFCLRKRGLPITTERVEYIEEDGRTAWYGRYHMERK